VAYVVSDNGGSSDAAPTYLWAKLVPDGEFYHGSGLGLSYGYGDGHDCGYGGGSGRGYGIGMGDKYGDGVGDGYDGDEEGDGGIYA
jgi:hypothetical protein